MTYKNPSSHEIRISQNLGKCAKKIDKMLKKATGDDCFFFLCVNSRRERNRDLELPTHREQEMQDMPVGSYIANSDRAASAIMMMELLFKWQVNGDIPPIHTLRDASGKTFAEIVGEHDH